MRVVIVNRSDTEGGAAVVARRLLHALLAQGVETDMLVARKHTDDEHVHCMGSKIAERAKWLAERLEVMAANRFSRRTLFMLDPGTHGFDITRHPLIQQADVVCLNWLNQGAVSLNTVERLVESGKHVVWTMHDMWNCTGACHHAGQCRKFTVRCSGCPLTGHNGEDMSTRTWQRKQRLYGKGSITFVPVSHWLEERCRESALMRGCTTKVIHNPFPTDDFGCSPLDATASYDVPRGKTVIAMGAARLDDSIKGFDTLISASRCLADSHRDAAQQVHLLLFGAMRDRSLLDRLAVPHTYLGTIDRPDIVMRNANVVLSTSRYETLPGTIIEGMACGCTPVATNAGGQSDIITHGIDGYLVPHDDPQAIAQAIAQAVSSPFNRQELHEIVKRKFDQPVIARQYIELFGSLLAKDC